MKTERQRHSRFREHFTLQPQLDIQGGALLLTKIEKENSRYLIARELKKQGVGPLRRHNTHVLITTESPEIHSWSHQPHVDGMLSVQARRDLFLHPINFFTGKDRKGHHEIRLNVGRIPQYATDAIREQPLSRESIVNGFTTEVNTALYEGIFRLSATLKDRRARHVIAFTGAAGVGMGLVVNRALSAIDGGATTSLFLWATKALKGTFSVPEFVHSLGWIAVGYAVGTAAFFLLYKIPHTRNLHKNEIEYLSEHRHDQLLQVHFPTS